MDISSEFWRKCSTCKKNIGYQSRHFVCSVSTCTRKRTGYVFCTVACWERHLPGARHRDAAAIEANAPTFAQWQQELEAPDDTAAPPAVRRFAQTTTNATVTKTQVPKEILVVASKLKDYIRLRSEMNTSAGVMEILSDKLRELCDEAIDRARVAGRKTVMDRDFEGD